MPPRHRVAVIAMAALAGALAAALTTALALVRNRAPMTFVTLWQIDADAERVWRELAAVETWPNWWPGMRSARFAVAGRIDEIGARAEVTVGGVWGIPLRFTLELTEQDPPRSARGRATGDLDGTGRLGLTPAATGTRVRLDWSVTPRSRIVRLIRPFAAAAHTTVMTAGERGLRARLA